MKINMAHLRDRDIDFAVFEADAPSHLNGDRSKLLSQLVFRARKGGLKLDKAALAFRQGSGIAFYGTRDLVRYLQVTGLPGWTHSLDV